MTTHRLFVALALFTGLGAACGGSSNKLHNRVNGAHLAPVSESERAGEAEAQREFFLAEWQVAFTKSQLNTAKLDINIAKNDLASAKLDVKNAQLELKAAEESSDQNAIAAKMQAQKVANLQIEVHKIAVERAKQNKRFLEKRLAHEERTLKSREAGVELARAKSLQSAGIRPPNFDAKTYKAQHSERAASAKAAKASVDSEKAELAAIDKRLLGARNAVAAAEGNPVAPVEPPETKPMMPLGDASTPPPGTEPTEPAKPEPDEATGPDEATKPDEPAQPETPANPEDPAEPSPAPPAAPDPKSSEKPSPTPDSGATPSTESQS